MKIESGKIKVKNLKGKSKRVLVLSVAFSALLYVGLSCSGNRQSQEQNTKSAVQTDIAQGKVIESTESHYPNPEDWDGKSPL